MGVCHSKTVKEGNQGDRPPSKPTDLTQTQFSNSPPQRSAFLNRAIVAREAGNLNVKPGKHKLPAATLPPADCVQLNHFVPLLSPKRLARNLVGVSVVPTALAKALLQANKYTRPLHCSDAKQSALMPFDDSEDSAVLFVSTKVNPGGYVGDSVVSMRRVLERVKSRFIANMSIAFQDDNLLYMVCEHPGASLNRLRHLNRGFSEGFVKAIVASVAYALKDIHDAGCAHGAVSVSSIILTPQGGVKLTNFSRATYPCTSKQQNEDWYALGVLAFQLLTGNLPCECYNSCFSLQGLVLIWCRGHRFAESKN